jgi:hypothetical protein
MQTIKYLVIVLAVIMSVCGTDASALVSISVHDTVIKRGVVSEIPVYIDLNGALPQNIELFFTFNAFSLDISSAKGGAGFIMNCNQPTTQTQLFDINNARVSISCTDINTSAGNILCLLKVEALTGSDTTSILMPDSIFFDGNKQENVLIAGGKITSYGSTVIERYPEGIGLNFPNPVFELIPYTIFPIIIDKDTRTEFNLFSFDGRRTVHCDIDFDKSLKLYRKSTSGEELIDNLESEIIRGEYNLYFYPNEYEFASGVYILQMKTTSGAYSRSFLIVK